MPSSNDPGLQNLGMPNIYSEYGNENFTALIAKYKDSALLQNSKPAQ